MKTFSYDPKTGRYEYRLTDTISKEEIKVLKLIKESTIASHRDIENMYRDDAEDDRFQLSHDVTFHLDYLGLIEWKDKYRVCVQYNAKDYKKSKYEEQTGYMLTENGKALMKALFPEPKKKLEPPKRKKHGRR